MHEHCRTLALALLGLLVAQWLHAEPFAYIARVGGLTVIDLGTHQVVADIAVPIDEFGAELAALPNDHRVYVRTSNRVLAIDSRISSVVATVPVTEAITIALNPSRPEAYVGIHRAFELVPGPRIFSVDTDLPTYATGFPNGPSPSQLAVSPGGERLYVLGSPAVDIFDVGSRQPVRSIRVAEATSMSMDSEEKRLFVQAYGRIYVIDIDSGAVTRSIPTPFDSSQIRVDRTGRRLFAGSGGVIYVIDADAGQIVATMNFGTLRGLDITPSGDELLVLSAEGVNIVDTVKLLLTDTIPVPNAVSTSGRFIGGGAKAEEPRTLTGLWWNPSEPGWGVHVTQRGSRIFAAWFTYNENGAPKWFVSSDCVLNRPPPTANDFHEDVSCSGNIYDTTGPRFFSDPYDPRAVVTNKLGLFQMSFSDRNTGAMSVAIGSAVKSMSLKRQVFAVNEPSASVDYTDLWWNPFESGWGMGITQQAGTMFLTWFAYDDTGAPTWYVASNCTMNAVGNGCTGELYRTSGPIDPLRNAFDPSKVKVTPVGSITASFNDIKNGTIRYTVDGKARTNIITRQFF